MSELSPEIVAIIAALQAQLLTIINQAAVVEFLLIESVGEDSEAIESSETLAKIIERASDTYSRLVNLQLRIAQLMEFLEREDRLPAMREARKTKHHSG